MESVAVTLATSRRDVRPRYMCTGFGGSIPSSRLAMSSPAGTVRRGQRVRPRTDNAWVAEMDEALFERTAALS